VEHVIPDWRDVVTRDFPPEPPVTQAAVDLAVRQGFRVRGSMRLSTGRVRTDAEHEAQRQRVLYRKRP
jgi:hypothetical protein